MFLLYACGGRRLRLAGCLLALAGCQRPAATAATDCLDPAKADPTTMCPMVYEPVCGCDGQTYSNACVAGRAGVRRYQAGACPSRQAPR